MQIEKKIQPAFQQPPSRLRSGFRALLPKHTGPYGMMDKERIAGFVVRCSRLFSKETSSVIDSAGEAVRLYEAMGPSHSIDGRLLSALRNLHSATQNYANKLQLIDGQMKELRAGLHGAERASYNAESPDPSLIARRLLFEEKALVFAGIHHKHNNILSILGLASGYMIKESGKKPADAQAAQEKMTAHAKIIEKGLGRLERSFSFMGKMVPSEVQLKPYLIGSFFIEVEPPQDGQKA
jgi:hypothetical protein